MLDLLLIRGHWIAFHLPKCLGKRNEEASKWNGVLYYSSSFPICNVWIDLKDLEVQKLQSGTIKASAPHRSALDKIGIHSCTVYPNTFPLAKDTGIHHSPPSLKTRVLLGLDRLKA